MRELEMNELRRQEFLRQAENYRLAQIANSAQPSRNFVGLRQLPQRLWSLRWRVTPVMFQVRPGVDLHNHKTEELPAVQF